jgi:hypothetical protein
MELKDGENPSSPAPLGTPSKHGGRTAFNVDAEAVERLSTSDLRTSFQMQSSTCLQQLQVLMMSFS